MAEEVDNSKWLKSKEARKELHVSACDLSHLRNDGKIEFKKEGNAFLYSGSDIDKLSKKKHDKS